MRSRPDLRQHGFIDPARKEQALSDEQQPDPRPWLRGIKGDQVLPLINADAPVIRVAAGPGTGKTFGLSRRVVRLIHPDGDGVSPTQVLVVAFNRVIAQDLNSSIAPQLAGIGLDGPRVSTVHALCHSAIVDERRMLLPSEREAMLYDVRVLHPTEFGSVHFGVLNQMLNDHEAEHRAYPRLIAAVQSWLTIHRARLVGDLPNELAGRIHGGDAEDLRFSHVIVDEFQDLTPAEQRLLARIVTPDGTLLALGDPCQSIYAFRGNDRNGLANLETLTGRPVTDLAMTECQRCPATVVEAVNELMVLDGAPMVSASSTEPNVHLVHWPTPAEEATGMAASVLANWRAHSGESHLVMVTRRRLGYLLRDAIRQLDTSVEVDLAFSESLLDTWEARDGFTFFCLLTDPDPGTWRAWLGNMTEGEKQGKAPSRNAHAYLRFLTRCDRDAIAHEDVAALAAEPRLRPRGQGGVHIWDRAKRFIDLHDSDDWLKMTPAQVITNALDPARWATDFDMDNPARDDLRVMQEQALATLGETYAKHPDWTPAECLRAVAADLRYRIAVREPFGARDESRIQVTTLWGAKGLTAQHVYVLGLCDEALPGRRSEEYPGSDADYEDEQRRLFFVALTRTKRTLVLSQVKGVRRSLGQQLGLAVSSGSPWTNARLTTCRFVGQIRRHLPPSVAGGEWGGCV